MLLCRWRLGSGEGWQRGWLESGEEGHGARIWSGRRDGGGWRMEMEVETATPCAFFVAITVPQMPLSKIDGMVNLSSERRANERHLTFGMCW
jgi:hypothetical protein